MKNQFQSFSTSVFCIGLLLITVVFAMATVQVDAITLTGSNGRAAELLGIKDATPKGITAQTVADGPIIGIPWSKLDLAALERDQKLIFAAYERAVAGETIALDLGSFSKMAMIGTDGAVKRRVIYKGWYDTSVGGSTFGLQMPLGEPRGILLLGVGDTGRSMHMLMGHDRGAGPWAEFQSKYGLAIISYDYDMRVNDPTKMYDFVYAEKGSGAAVMGAISNFASELKKPEFADLPIAVCGTDRVGAAFAYHFALWKPEIILGGVFAKGGFYDAEPGPEAAKIPMVFIWGQYSNNDQIWHNENSAEHVLKKYASMKPNWTSAMEYRGNGEANEFSDHFIRISLKAILDERLPERKPKPEPKPEPDPEAGAEGKKGEGKAKGEEGEEEMEEPEPEPLIIPFDRSNGMIGNLDTGETLKITDPEAALGEEETFIFSSGYAGAWKKFLTGDFAVPPRN